MMKKHKPVIIYLALDGLYPGRLNGKLQRTLSNQYDLSPRTGLLDKLINFWNKLWLIETSEKWKPSQAQIKKSEMMDHIFHGLHWNVIENIDRKSVLNEET